MNLQSVLLRVPDLFIEVDSSNSARISFRGKQLSLNQHGLSLLSIFAQPHTIENALKLLAPQLPSERAVQEALNAIITLANVGILHEPSKPVLSCLPSPESRYDSPFVHTTMLNDKTRKEVFLKALREVVTPEDIVLDVGTGSGIHAVGAALAGAKHIYAIEPYAFGEIAQGVFEDNQVTDKVTLIRGWLSQVQLPELASVLVTDIIGNEPLGMQIWETLRDAKARLLKKDAKLIPNAIEIYANLVKIPDTFLLNYQFNKQYVERWQKWYGIDFSAMLRYSESRTCPFYIKPHEAHDWEFVSDPVLIAVVDFTTDSQPHLDVKFSLAANKHTEANGVLVHFLARLSPTVSLSTFPSDGGIDSLWFCPVWATPQPIPLNIGEKVAFRYTYFGEGVSDIVLE